MMLRVYFARTAASVKWMVSAVLAVVVTTSVAAAQQPPPPPPPGGVQTPLPEPIPPPPPTDVLHRGELFGDWGGARTKLGAEGTKIDASFTQFFDWVPVGDDDRGFDYGGKFDVKVQSNLSKFLWDGFSATGHFELDMATCLFSPVAR